MENIISEELLSEVLGEKVEHIYDESDKENCIDYKLYYGGVQSINVHELAHKCKDKAYNLGYYIFTCKQESCSYSAETHIFVNGIGYVFKHKSTSSVGEYEAVFNEYRWILDNKDKK